MPTGCRKCEDTEVECVGVFKEASAARAEGEAEKATGDELELTDLL